MVTAPANPVTAQEFDELFRRCSNWGRWGADDTKGARNLAGPAQVARAATLVRTGVTVSCARPLVMEAAVDNPAPAMHYMTNLPRDEHRAGTGLGVACDFLGLECHGEVQSHLDALCHIAFGGHLFNGWPADSVGLRGAARGGLEAAASGTMSRGVLLDVAALHNVPWLDGGYEITADELSAAQEAAGVTVESGDVVLLRTGHALRRVTEGPWDAGSLKAGLHPRAMPWLKDRDICAIGFDGDGDAAPNSCPGLSIPVHVLGITAMGLHFFDALTLEDLAAECARQGRSEFLFTAAPVHAPGATGCAINPVSIF
jgi:kynurenine formamidase